MIFTLKLGIIINSKAKEELKLKEATGELNMTVITVVAIAAVAAFFYAFLWPAIQQGLSRNTCENSGGTYTANNGEGGERCCTYPGTNGGADITECESTKK